MTDINIREARPADLDGVYSIFNLADIMHRQAHPEIFQEVADPSGTRDYIMMGIQADDAIVFVAEIQDEIIGAVIAVIRQTLEISVLISGSYVSIENLVVARKFRKLGTGKALMEAVHLWTRERGLNQIQLTVWDFNKEAQVFYEKVGYEMLHHRMRMVLP
jgi:GNAT superfamily N-acetyltransferase